ncbi:unnamed protein product [Dibothriocephalus latus]|uniref:Uncharacterized protein n=1 Tax=Dibothriocephalus latus TaxID=60516 RepID=A0A3P6QRL6_DIBLA|nr:unnamed protein product [Dibothriocephalus latus]
MRRPLVEADAVQASGAETAEISVDVVASLASVKWGERHGDCLWNPVSCEKGGMAVAH